MITATEGTIGFVADMKKDRERKRWAWYVGYQEGFGDVPGFHAWNLYRAIPGHPEGSTVAESTLDAAIF
jgi:hypothetical protein